MNDDIAIAQAIADVMMEKNISGDAAISATIHLLATMAKLANITKTELVDLVEVGYDIASKEP